MDDFISEADLRTFEGWAKSQGFDPAAITPEELKEWQSIFADVMERLKTSPKVGLVKLQPVAGEQKYAVAIRDGSNLWLTMWVRCSRKGEIFIMFPRGDRDWDPHVSYHLDGTFHSKSYDTTSTSEKKQPLTAAFRGNEHLGWYQGHGKTGTDCDPQAFDGVVVVEPGILGRRNGSVAVDLVEPGYEATWDSVVYERRVFLRSPRPSVVITIQR
jgi:hypothetical protein